MKLLYLKTCSVNQLNALQRLGYTIVMTGSNEFISSPEGYTTGVRSEHRVKRPKVIKSRVMTAKACKKHHAIEE